MFVRVHVQNVAWASFRNTWPHVTILERERERVGGRRRRRRREGS